jgi:hypothetical protein
MDSTDDIWDSDIATAHSHLYHHHKYCYICGKIHIETTIFVPDDQVCLNEILLRTEKTHKQQPPKAIKITVSSLTSKKLTG